MQTKIYLFLALCLFCCSTVFAQHEKKIVTAKQYIKEKLSDWKLTERDIADLSVDKAFESSHNGVTHIYLRQQYKGIKIFNAIATVNILPNGKVLYASHRFLPKIESLVNTTQPTLSPEEAIQAAAVHLKIEGKADFTNKKAEDKNIYSFKKTTISSSDIKVELVYERTSKGKLHLAWQLAIDMLKTPDYWDLRVDATDGTILSQNNWTNKCSFGAHKHTHNCGFLENKNSTITTTNTFNTTTAGETYNVFAFPVESPIHGSRSLVVSPNSLTASPFGWHDTDGVEGAEFTITRGNNVHAYADVQDRDVSPGNEPDGGTELVFDFPLDLTGEPEVYRDAATTQLFYSNNMMHDIAASYGFDEVAGNFQEKHYVASTVGDGDYVMAEAQDGYDLVPENSNDYTDNANFSTPPDGSNGRMQMYIWEQSGGRLLQVSEPAEVAGSYDTGEAVFGPEISTTAISGQIAVVDDGSSNTSTLGCRPLINADEIAGKIALVDRGACDFVQKTGHASKAGAIAVIICNFENSLITLGASPNFNDTLSIPTIMLRGNDCQVLRTLADDGLEITLQRAPRVGAEYLDADFDNSVVTHEYAHGISTRLTGGSNNSSCLNNDEQMGEGWSDFFSLITTVKPTDTGKERRGIGTYLLRQETEGQGIRRFPYSTDMNVNPFTYKDIIGTGAVHSVGEVWTGMLWDLYWKMSEEHGWEADLFNGQVGNNMAIQLVMDGMKIQACNPGFIDGRDAILAADRANYGGANQCLIWEVFARRGLGFSASQGDERDRNDAIEAYDTPPFCTQELQLVKTATEMVVAGDEIAFTLNLSNFKGENATNVVLTDELPEGLTYVVGSASMESTLQGNTLRFEIGDLANEETMKITYRATTAKDKFSTRQFYDDMENGDDFWLIIDEENSNFWGLQDVFFNSGENAFHVANVDDESEQYLQLDEEIEVKGNNPMLRFFHWYSIDEGTDGGIVEISIDGGSSWEDLGPHITKNSYVGPIAYTTFAIPNLRGYWGDSEEFIDTYIDLSAFKGETVTIRFRYGTTEIGNAIPGKAYQGWFVDDVEFLDVFAYQSEACATSAEGDNVCALAEAGGTVVEAGELTSVQDLEDLGLKFAVFPNPASDYLNVQLSNETANDGIISIFNMNGQELLQQNLRITSTTQLIPFNVSDIPSGFYFVKVQTNEGIAVKKVILE